MQLRTAALLFAAGFAALATFPGRPAVHAQGDRRAPAAAQPVSNQDRARLLAAGKEIFSARCAKCHNENGDKPLSSGPPLNERALSTHVIARAVKGRLRDKTEDERRAVTLYISSFMKPTNP